MPTSAIPPRLLLGPGPSNVSPRVLAAMGQPLLGHLDPAFLAIVEEVQARLRRLFGTRNELTLPLSATGSAGMEACLVNLLERGDDAVVGVAGVFGERMCEVAARCGARVTRVETDPGTALEPGAMAAAIARVRPRVVAFVHAETSTGVLQPVEEIAAAARAADAHLVLDCVTSLGGLPAGPRRLGRRRGLQRHTEVSLLPARPLAGELLATRARARPEPQEPGAELVSRRDAPRGLLR